ncbi:hypothetical protein GCM10022384_36770 [Streptomyces marokkonensis]|uniref:Uncharacterized protein n=1 Tax=Streptomyces marokkonensis TaxID=324855 RepID=A0ABP7QP10_9ACTN
MWVRVGRVQYLPDRQIICKADGTVAAEIDAVGGVIGLSARKLVADPRQQFKELAAEPGVLGL